MDFLQKPSGDQAVTPLSKCYPSESRILYLTIPKHTKAFTRDMGYNPPTNHLSKQSSKIEFYSESFFAQHTKSHKNTQQTCWASQQSSHPKKNHKTNKWRVYGINNITCVRKFTYNKMYINQHHQVQPMHWIPLANGSLATVPGTASQILSNTHLLVPCQRQGDISGKESSKDIALLFFLVCCC